MKNRLRRCPISRASSSASGGRLTRSLSAGCNRISVIDLIVLCVIIAYPPYRRASAEERLKTDMRTWVSNGGLHTARPYREKNKTLCGTSFLDSKFKYQLFYFYFNYRAVIILYYIYLTSSSSPGRPIRSSSQ